jgi:hypothetical protein
MKNLSLKPLIFLISILLYFIQVNAQDFEVAPVMINFQVEPGNNDSRKVSIINHSDKTQSFSLKLADYELDSLGRSVRLQPGQSGRSISNMVTFSPSYFELPPNGRIYVDVMITVPSGEYGTKWGIISVEASQEKSSIDADKSLVTGILLSPRIAIFINQSPKSNKNYKGKILSFNETTKEGSESRTFTVVAQNVGDKELKAEVSLMLADLNTGEETKLSSKKENIYPGVKKNIDFIVKDLKPGKYALAAILDYGHNSDLEGSQIIIEQK